MGISLIGHNEVYNFFSSVSDAPLFESGFTEEMLTKYIKEEYGNQGLRDLPLRLIRVKNKGTSSFLSDSLEDDISIFLQNENMSIEYFLNKYLSIKES